MPFSVLIAIIILLSVFTLIHPASIPLPFGRLICILAFLCKALVNHLWFGKNLKDAIDTRVVFVNSQSDVKLEPKAEKVTFSVFI